jgi:hypothetical protein
MFSIEVYDEIIDFVLAIHVCYSCKLRTVLVVKSREKQVQNELAEHIMLYGLSKNFG